MTASLPLVKILRGIHRVRYHGAKGVREYWYAWRGGPSILRARAKSDALLDAEVARLAPAAIALAQEKRRPKDMVTLYGLITRYLESPQFARAAPRTQADRRKHLDFVRNELGMMEVAALRARGARRALIAWRDGFGRTPKTADSRLGALSTVLQWAADNGELELNPLARFPRIYQANRADVVWEPHHLAIIAPYCSPDLDHAIRLATSTALRIGDLVRLPWSAVGEDAIVWQTGKSRGRRTVVIPITNALRKLLAEIPRQASPTILNSARRRAWTVPGLESAIGRAKRQARKAAHEAGGPDAESGVDHLRFHDLRGTAATNFVRAGLTLQEVATILGWEKNKVEQIAARYVSGEAIGKAIAERLRKAEAEAEADAVVREETIEEP